MLRLIVIAILALAAIWYFAGSAGEQERIADSQREALEEAQVTAEAFESSAQDAAAAAQAARDAAMGIDGGSAGDEAAP